MNEADRLDIQWWLAHDKGREPHNAVTDIVQRLRRKQEGRRQAYLHYARSYASSEVNGLTVGTYQRVPAIFNPSTLAFNVVASACNTVQAKIAKNRPLPMFLTSGGDWEQQTRAKNMSKFVEGEFYRCDLYETDPLIVLDALVFGEGYVKVYRDNERIYVDREFPWRVMFDETESQYGMKATPSCYQRNPVDRQKLVAMFPDKKAEILDATNSGDDENEWGFDNLSDQLIVTEAWHRRSSKTAGDGRHTVVINGVTLADEPYEKDYFPFVQLQRNKPQMGVHGIGLAEELDGIQYEINFTAYRVQQSHRRMGGSHWLVEQGAKVSIEQLNNGIATIVRYAGTAPVPQNVQPVHPDTYAYLLSLIPKAYEMSGVSQLSAQSQKPAGLDSGAALREFNDAETERFVVFAKEFENFHVEIARQMLDLGRELAEINPDYAVQSRGKRFTKRLKFLEVALPEDDFVMQCFPTAMLSKTPAGRMAQVSELAKAGWISPQQAKRLLDFPDLEQVADLENASHELVEELIERMLYEGLYEEPEPYMDIVDALSTCTNAYLRAKIDNCPDANRRMLRQFIDALKALLDAQAPANDVAPPMPGAAPPPGGPMPPPPLPGAPPLAA